MQHFAVAQAQYVDISTLLACPILSAEI